MIVWWEQRSFSMLRRRRNRLMLGSGRGEAPGRCRRRRSTAFFTSRGPERASGCPLEEGGRPICVRPRRRRGLLPAKTWSGILRLFPVSPLLFLSRHMRGFRLRTEGLFSGICGDGTHGWQVSFLWISLPRGAWGGDELCFFDGDRRTAGNCRKGLIKPPDAAGDSGSRGGKQDQQPPAETDCTDSGRLAGHRATAAIGTPGIMGLSDDVFLSEALSWAEKRPLHGLGVLLPVRRAGGPSQTAASFREEGAEVVELPGSGRSRSPSTEQASPVLRKSGNIKWIAFFASEAGVSAF